MKAKSIFKDALAKWWSADPLSLGAALAFYTIFALIPLLVIAMSIAGTLIDPRIIETKLISELAVYLGKSTANFISTLVVQVEQPETSVVANIIAAITLIIGAVSVFSQLQFSLNKLWNVPPNHTGGFLAFFERKVSALLIMLGFGLLFIVSFMLTVGLNAFHRIIDIYYPNMNIILLSANYVLSFVIVVTMFMFVYKYLPNTVISWTGALEGSLVTGLLFIIGSLLIGAYLHFVPIASSYGTAGSIIVVLLWVYYSSQVFFLGAAVTYVMNKRTIHKNVLV